MPWMFRPRVGPLVYRPSRRRSPVAQVVWAVVVLVFVGFMLAAAIQGAGR